MHEDVKPGEGTVDEAKHRAVFRDASAVLHEFDSRCTHRGCDVAWNPEEQTWDCPCHGSKFASDGRVLNGPAKEPLSSRDSA